MTGTFVMTWRIDLEVARLGVEAVPYQARPMRQHSIDHSMDHHYIPEGSKADWEGGIQDIGNFGVDLGGMADDEDVGQGMGFEEGVDPVDDRSGEGNGHTAGWAQRHLSVQSGRNKLRLYLEERPGVGCQT